MPDIDDEESRDIVLATPAQTIFSDVVGLAGLLAAAFYILTALATVAYYRFRIFSNVWDAILTGIMPIGAAAFLIWIVWKSIQGEPASQRWSLIGIVASGLLVMVAVRVTLRPPYFQTPRESA